MAPRELHAARSRWQAVVIACGVTIAATQVGRLVQLVVDGSDWYSSDGVSGSAEARLRELALLGFGLILVSTSLRSSGVTTREAKNVRKAVLLSLGVVGVAAVYRYFPFDGSQDSRLFDLRLRSACTGTSSWLTSPLAQQLVFTGFTLGFLQKHLPDRAQPRLPINGAVAMTALLFGLWHIVPDFFVPDSFVGHGSAYDMHSDSQSPRLGWLLSA